MRTKFSFELLPESQRDFDGKRMGEMKTSDGVERFTVFPLLGNDKALEKVWLKRLKELIVNGKPVGLPTASNMTWIFYPSGTRIRIHEMFMLYPYALSHTSRPIGPRLTKSGRVTHIPPYRSKTDDGHRISEWTTTVAAIIHFLKAKGFRG